MQKVSVLASPQQIRDIIDVLNHHIYNGNGDLVIVVDQTHNRQAKHRGVLTFRSVNCSTPHDIGQVRVINVIHGAPSKDMSQEITILAHIAKLQAKLAKLMGGTMAKSAKGNEKATAPRTVSKHRRTRTKMEPAIENTICMLRDQDKSYKETIAYLKDKGVSCCESTISRILKKHGKVRIIAKRVPQDKTPAHVPAMTL